MPGKDWHVLFLNDPPALTTFHAMKIGLGDAAAEMIEHVVGEHFDLCFGIHVSVIVACWWVRAILKIASFKSIRGDFLQINFAAQRVLCFQGCQTGIQIQKASGL